MEITPALRPNTFGRGRGLLCIHCKWVDVSPSKRNPLERSLGCANPKCCGGQAGEGKSCSQWQREPGSDDEL